MKKDVLPPLTTMMLDVLANTMRLPEHSRTKAVCRCVLQVYSINHGVKPPWELTGETPEECKERVTGRPVTIIDAKVEVTDESTRAYDSKWTESSDSWTESTENHGAKRSAEDRGTRERPVAVSSTRVSRCGSVSRVNGKRV